MTVKNDSRDKRNPDPVDMASTQSFPASDPPAHHVDRKAPKTAADLPPVQPIVSSSPKPTEPK
jgi:hypothetical protein